mgnify:FL=1|tara:strand:- start:190 stop:843 length:654 start_codon:yes stop_codon:yes gene_type:complete
MLTRKLKVYGLLRKFCGQSYFDVVVKNPQQAINFLKANFPELEKHMANQVYKVKINGKDIDDMSLNVAGDIQVIPVVIGAGRTISNIGKFIVGAVVYYYTGGFAALGYGTAPQLGGFLAKKFVSQTLQFIGASLLFSGAAGLIGGSENYGGPTNFSDTDPNLRASYSFSGINNVATSGTPIPICYGEILTGSIIISSGVDSLQVRRTLNSNNQEFTG